MSGSRTPEEMKNIELQFMKFALGISTTMEGVPGEVKKFAEALSNLLNKANETNRVIFTTALMEIMTNPEFKSTQHNQALKTMLETAQVRISNRIERKLEENQEARAALTGAKKAVSKAVDENFESKRFKK
jgi:phage I-like protein